MNKFIETCYAAVRDKNFKFYHDTIVDTFTASAVTQVYNGLSNDAKLAADALAPDKLLTIVWKLIA